jgi:hypothetical protein
MKTKARKSDYVPVDLGPPWPAEASRVYNDRLGDQLRAQALRGNRPAQMALATSFIPRPIRSPLWSVRANLAPRGQALQPRFRPVD